MEGIDRSRAWRVLGVVLQIDEVSDMFRPVTNGGKISAD